MDTKNQLKEFIEKLTMREFPHLCRLSKYEIENIKQFAIESEVFWKIGTRDIDEEYSGQVGCGAVCEHGHNKLTCPDCSL